MPNNLQNVFKIFKRKQDFQQQEVNKEFLTDKPQFETFNPPETETKTESNNYYSQPSPPTDWTSDLYDFFNWLEEYWQIVRDYAYPVAWQKPLTAEEAAILEIQAKQRNAIKTMQRAVLKRKKQIRHAYNNDRNFFYQKKVICQNWHDNKVEILQLKRNRDEHIFVNENSGPPFEHVPGWNVPPMERQPHLDELCHNLRCINNEHKYSSFPTNANSNFEQNMQYMQLYQENTQIKQKLETIEKEYQKCRSFVENNYLTSHNNNNKYTENQNNQWSQSQHQQLFQSQQQLPSISADVETQTFVKNVEKPVVYETPNINKNSYENNLNQQTLYDRIIITLSFPLDIISGDVLKIKRSRWFPVNSMIVFVKCLLACFVAYIYYKIAVLVFNIVQQVLDSLLSYLPKKQQRVQTEPEPNSIFKRIKNKKSNRKKRNYQEEEEDNNEESKNFWEKKLPFLHITIPRGGELIPISKIDPSTITLADRENILKIIDPIVFIVVIEKLRIQMKEIALLNRDYLNSPKPIKNRLQKARSIISKIKRTVWSSKIHNKFLSLLAGLAFIAIEITLVDDDILVLKNKPQISKILELNFEYENEEKYLEPNNTNNNTDKKCSEALILAQPNNKEKIKIKKIKKRSKLVKFSDLTPLPDLDFVETDHYIENTSNKEMKQLNKKININYD